ncbi:hypothetical protein CLM62_27595 [Streptomyces sp. SA15]|uniref:hypothetical protein n=1 Tax=Streptomyces sp. SA15 TaxID=934019 RepID=UPI000BAF7759|nr:hypothetical protein [Streptomyces sp. SA15]PAZ12899.1 hypothetical protein CLM62_27595 [Streptomyces sp. SA15]
MIAAVIRRFDVVAVQEVRGNLRALRYLLKVLGEDWAFILTDVTEGKAGTTSAWRSCSTPAVSNPPAWPARSSSRWSRKRV